MRSMQVCLPSSSLLLQPTAFGRGWAPMLGVMARHAVVLASAIEAMQVATTTVVDGKDGVEGVHLQDGCARH